jgi:hypothetical protein
MFAVLLVVLRGVLTTMSLVLVRYQLARILFNAINVGAPVRAMVTGF